MSLVAARSLGTEPPRAPAPSMPELPGSDATGNLVDPRGVSLALGPDGEVGAWLLAGPFRSDGPPEEPRVAQVDAGALRPSLKSVVGAPASYAGRGGGPARWVLGASASPTLDLQRLLGGPPPHVVAYAGGLLRLARPEKVLLLLAIDDGVRVFVDGRAVYTRFAARPLRADDDVVALDLDRGEHAVVLELAQRTGAWAFRARFLAKSLAPLVDASFVLPGTSEADARTMARTMASVSLARTFDGVADPPELRPKLTVRYAGGAPLGASLDVRARLRSPARPASNFDLHAGAPKVGPNGTEPLEIALPSLDPIGGEALEVSIAGKTFTFPVSARPSTLRSLAHATRALRGVAPDAPWLKPGSFDSVTFLVDRMARLVSTGDGDLDAQASEARELEMLATALDRHIDPYVGRTGPMRRAIRSRFDGQLSEFGLYLPAGFRAEGGSSYPLIVGLHGLNGRAMGMMRWLFGGASLGPDRSHLFQDRHLGNIPGIGAIVVTPLARGNSFYREIGEVDVSEIIDWVRQAFPVDPARISITGASMGGTGAASIPLHLPNVFAAAEPLCGYHSYRIRNDVRNYTQRPWETYLVEERSNADWAENGERLPLWIVHGTRDLPVRNSDVLIEAYEKLGYSVKHDHPDLGHNVWEPTYANLRGMNWLLSHRLDTKPARVRFKTSRTRWGTSAWITIDELAGESQWGEIDARIDGGAKLKAQTRGIAALRFDRRGSPLEAGPKPVVIDGQALEWTEDGPLFLHRSTDGLWQRGPATRPAPVKGGHVTGPIRDVFYEPILFVYGDAPDERRVNEHIARAFARGHGGVDVSYPVLSDTEFFTRGEPLGHDRALFLVGRTSRVRAELERRHPGAFPIHVDQGSVTIGATRRTGEELGAAFILPNPERPDRYVVVVAGADTRGALRALSLPDLLPDFVVWDAGLAPARGQVVLGHGRLVAGGFFTKDWKLPPQTEDPLTRSVESSEAPGAIRTAP